MSTRSRESASASLLEQASKLARRGQEQEALVRLWSALETAETDRELEAVAELAESLVLSEDEDVRNEATSLIERVDRRLGIEESLDDEPPPSEEQPVEDDPLAEEQLEAPGAYDEPSLEVSEPTAGPEPMPTPGPLQEGGILRSPPPKGLVVWILSSAIGIAISVILGLLATHERVSGRAPSFPGFRHPAAYFVHPDGTGERELLGFDVGGTIVTGWYGDQAIASRDDYAGSWLVDLATGEWSWLLGGGPSAALAASVSSRDEVVLAYRNGTIYTARPRTSFAGEYTHQLTASGMDRDPRWSPDGDRIAFVSERSGKFQIYVIDADGSNLRQLTSKDTSNSFNPVWSSSGEILFSSAWTANWEIYAVNVDSSEISQVTHSDEQELQISLSPDGSQVAYMGEVEGGWHVFVSDLDGSDAHQITFGPGNEGMPFWSPDGQWIGFTRDQGARSQG